MCFYESQPPFDTSLEVGKAMTELSQDEFSGAISTTKSESVLLRHIGVHAIADYYNIPQLANLAKTKLQQILVADWPVDSFATALGEAFRSTCDASLHDIFTSTATAHIEELIDQPDLCSMELMSGFSQGVLRNLLAERRAERIVHDFALQKSETQLGVSKGCVEVLQATLCSAVERADCIVKNFEKCIEVLNKTARCGGSHCSARFGCCIITDTLSNPPTYKLYCSTCQCEQQD